MPAKFYYDTDADLSIVRNKKVAFVGYGNQGMLAEDPITLVIVLQILTSC
jgi:ketol-acid reductoisomerase